MDSIGIWKVKYGKSYYFFDSFLELVYLPELVHQEQLALLFLLFSTFNEPSESLDL